jgi:hypothetical protein
VANDEGALGRRFAWLLMGLATGCLLALGVAVFLIPPRFETHNQAVGYILQQHGITYDEVRLIHAWPDTLSRSSYSADVVVQLHNAGRISGRIECKVERSQCYLYLRKLDIWHEPVPDLTSTPPWLARLQQYASTFVALVRGL